MDGRCCDGVAHWKLEQRELSRGELDDRVTSKGFAPT
jgi:hypothetical protein